MHVFHIKGLSGLLMFVLAVVMSILLVIVLPSTFMMVFWNALVFEGMSGPEISISQGFILWLMMLTLFKLVFKPEIQFQFRQVGDLDINNKKPSDKKD